MSNVLETSKDINSYNIKL